MFGMVTALVVQEASAARSSAPVAQAALAAGSTAFACTIPQIG